MESLQNLVQALPPETLEGWYSLHQVFQVDRAGADRGGNATPAAETPRVELTRISALCPPTSDRGWTAFVRLVGSTAHLMAIHFRPTLEALGDAQRALEALPCMARCRSVYSFLSVTEAGLYHLTAQLAREADARGGKPGDDEYSAELARRVQVERESSHVQRRLFPVIPDGMPYVSFYPMSKRRAPDQNWYALGLDERSRLMQAHGRTGRRYAGRVLQIITGAVGLDAWEWGVTLFARDPLDFKKLVTDMRFDEVSARYAEFGQFYVGKLLPAGELETAIETIGG